MKKIIFSTFFLLHYFFSFSQVIVSNDFTCVYSEIPDRGHGLTNGKITFYIDAKSRDLYTKKMENDFLKIYKKTKDNLFYSTGFRDGIYFYEIVIPESLFVLTLSSTKNNTLFNKYSVELLASVRKNRYKESRIFFIRANKKNC